MIMNFTPPLSSAGGSVKMVLLADLVAAGTVYEPLEENTIYGLYIAQSNSYVSDGLDIAPGKWSMCCATNSNTRAYVGCAQFEIGEDGTVVDVPTQPMPGFIKASSSDVVVLACTVGQKPYFLGSKNATKNILFYLIKTE